MFLKWFLGLSYHMRIAILVAPVLLIGGYGLMDVWVTKDQPKPAVQVKMLPFDVGSECLLTTNQCTLKREGLVISLTRAAAKQPGLVRLELDPHGSSIRGIQLALVQAGVEQQVAMEASEAGQLWVGEFPESVLQPAPSALRIAVAQFGRVSYAEVPVRF